MLSKEDLRFYRRSEIVNKNDRKYYSCLYMLTLGSYGEHTFSVYANCLSDAIDTLADYCAEKGYEGFFNDGEAGAYYNETDENYNYLQESYIPAGNNGRLFAVPAFVAEVVL